MNKAQSAEAYHDTDAFPGYDQPDIDVRPAGWFKAMNKAQTQTRQVSTHDWNMPSFPELNVNTAASAKDATGNLGRVRLRDGREEDRTRDWICSHCGERNFMKRHECHKCRNARPRDIAGTGDCSQNEWEDLIRQHCDLSDSSSSRRKKKRKKKKKKKSSSSSSSSSSRSRSARKRKRSRSQGSISSGSKRAAGKAAAPVEKPAGNPEIEKAKNEALQRLMKLKGMPTESRNKQFRGLLREWHPDKHPDNVEVATAVFQFLQKGKPLIQDS
jgi:hypothetical protein